MVKTVTHFVPDFETSDSELFWSFQFLGMKIEKIENLRRNEELKKKTIAVA